jgi:hypothetical protein
VWTPALMENDASRRHARVRSVVQALLFIVLIVGKTYDVHVVLAHVFWFSRISPTSSATRGSTHDTFE